jgi:hypothetical protein
MIMKQEQEGVVSKFFNSQDVKFCQSCANVLPPYGKKNEGIPATHRQASKWLRGKGIAYKTMKGRV